MVWERFYGGAESSAPFEMKDRDVRMDPLVAVQRPYCPPIHMDAEDNLFILYTSGSTGESTVFSHCVEFAKNDLLDLTIVVKQYFVLASSWEYPFPFLRVASTRLHHVTHLCFVLSTCCTNIILSFQVTPRVW